MASVQPSRGTAFLRRAVANIDLAAIEHNTDVLIKKLRRGTKLCAVVKADGYGHGGIWASRAAVAGGATWLAVATAAEAEELRRHHLTERVLVMGALTHDEIDRVLRAEADLVVWHQGFLEAVDRRAGEIDKRARVHVKLDTGMGRLGTFDADEALNLVKLADDEMGHAEPAGFMSHFATADEPEDDYFELQLRLFSEAARRVKRAHPGCLVHAANSAATIRQRAAHFDMVRCGIAVYGMDPFHDDPCKHDLRPALELESFVADVKRFSAGQSAGYGRSWQAPEETMVGVIPLGYGDGVRRGLTNVGEVLVRGRRHPIVGTVSMDNLTVDLGRETDVQPGDAAVLIGAQGEERILAEDVARQLDTINYEVTCGLLPRVERRYHLEDSSASA